MVLDIHPTYPTNRSYVVKLHRDAAPERGLIFGRLENVSTGKHFAFESERELLAILARDASDQQI